VISLITLLIMRLV